MELPAPPVFAVVVVPFGFSEGVALGFGASSSSPAGLGEALGFGVAFGVAFGVVRFGVAGLGVAGFGVGFGVVGFGVAGLGVAGAGVAVTISLATGFWTGSGSLVESLEE